MVKDFELMVNIYNLKQKYSLFFSKLMFAHHWVINFLNPDVELLLEKLAGTHLGRGGRIK